MPVWEWADGNLNGGKHIRENGEKRENSFGDAEIEDHDPIECAVERHKRNGDGCMNESELKSFDEHNFLWAFNKNEQGRFWERPRLWRSNCTFWGKIRNVDLCRILLEIG